MSFQLDYVDDIPVLGVDGELSRRNLRWLDDMIYSVLKHGQSHVILDLSRVQHVDYKLVEHLNKRIKELKNVGGGIALAAANYYVRRIFEAMGWQEQVYCSVGDALLAMCDEAVHKPWQ